MPLEFRPAAAQRLLVNTPIRLTTYKLDQYGENTTPVGAVTVTVTRADGTAIATDAVALALDVSNPNRYEYGIDAADNNLLDWLTAVWADAGDDSTWTTSYEIVGGFYASIAEIRLRDPGLADAGKFPASTIRSFMEEIETAFELECGRSFVPRYCRERISGPSRDRLLLSNVDIRSIRSVRDYTDYQTYTGFTTSELAALDHDMAGSLVRIDGAYWYCGSGNYIIEYEHGMDRPPADVKAAAIRWLRASLKAAQSAVPNRASAYTVDSGAGYSLIVPPPSGSVSGIAEVDSVIDRYRVQRFMVGI